MGPFSTIPGRTGIWKLWPLRRGENRSSLQRKPVGARERTNNKLYPHMVSTLEFEPASH